MGMIMPTWPDATGLSIYCPTWPSGLTVSGHFTTDGPRFAL